MSSANRMPFVGRSSTVSNAISYGVIVSVVCSSSWSDRLNPQSMGSVQSCRKLGGTPATARTASN
eukprot:scaffold134990_cov44-Attheya_sp.AAC.1